MFLKRTVTAAVLAAALGISGLATAPAPAQPGLQSVSDLNGDGRADVLARVGTTGTMISYFGNGASGFSGSLVDAGGWSSADFAHPAPGFSGPGSADVLMRDHFDGSLRLYRATNGKLSGGSKIGQNWQGMNAIILPGDFNGDGNPDVLARRDSDASLWLYAGNGRGGWAGARQVGRGWHNMDMMFSAGDFDGDGNADVIARHKGDATLWLYPGNGRGGWKTPRQIGRGWYGMDHLFSVGDFDRDGPTDVVARQAETGDLLLYRGNGRGGWRGVRKIGQGWSKMSLPGIWESTATKPLPEIAAPTPPTPPKPKRTQPFVYGTLRKGQPAYNRMLAGNTTREVKTTVSGYDMYMKVSGTYPYALSTIANSTIVGEEMHIKDSVYWAVLNRLDTYEGYNPDRPLSQQSYMRTQTRSARGTKVWIYEATPRMKAYLVSNGVRITSGDWFKRSAGSSRSAAPSLDTMSQTRPVSPAELGLTISQVATSPTCASPFGQMEAENGTFVSFRLDLNVPEELPDLDYLPAIPEAFSLSSAHGTFDGGSSSAQACMAGIAPLAFVDAGTATSGTIILDVPENHGGILAYQVTPDLIALISLDGTPLPDQPDKLGPALPMAPDHEPASPGEEPAGTTEAPSTSEAPAQGMEG
ncbi:MAG: FG-GAP-like repeat-containing protein, partial [Flaviflexus sp.]|nr:FG-GAP-like repeat-containing protein [Flaviflexus sp.]